MSEAQPETATPQRNPATGLPPELLEAIFLHTLHHNVAYRPYLLAYPLVCRTWSRPAQRVLFMDVTLYGTTKAAKFLRAIEGNPSLSHGTKLLGFGFWEGNLAPFRSDVPEAFQIIKNIVARCPNLYHLQLPIPLSVTLKSILELAKYPNLSSLPTLSLQVVQGRAENNYSETQPPKLLAKDFFHFLREFSGISHLGLEGINLLESVNDDEAYAIPPMFKLYELRYDFIWPISTPTYTKILRWLMGGGATSDHLRFLEVKSFEEELEAPISQFLEAHGSSLIFLCIYCSQEDQLSQITFSRISSGLKALRLPWCFIPGSLRKKLKLPNLEYLEFAEGHASDEWEEDEETGEVSEINDTVKWVMELPKLRSLWFHVGEVGLGWDYFVEKWEKCRQKGIAVSVLDRGHTYIVEDDFIKSEHFPRGNSVENLARMRVPVRNSNDG